MDRVAHADAHFAFTHAELLEHLHQRDLAVVRHEQIEELVQNLLLGVPGSGTTLLGIANGNQNANRFQDFVRAVSYTHLDVYKRQASTCYSQFWDWHGTCTG